MWFANEELVHNFFVQMFESTLVTLFSSFSQSSELSVGTVTSFEKPSIESLNLLDKSDLRLLEGLSGNVADPVPSHFI